MILDHATLADLTVRFTPRAYVRVTPMAHAATPLGAGKCRDKRREHRRAVLAAPAAQQPPASSLWFWLILLFVLCEEARDKLAESAGAKPKALAPQL